MKHAYVSTACVHEQHVRCRRVCKFCPAECACECHRVMPSESPTVPGTPHSIGRRLLIADRPSRKDTVPNLRYAFTGKNALLHLRRSFEEAHTPEDRKRVREIARKLVDQGFVTDSEIAPFIGLPEV